MTVPVNPRIPAEIKLLLVMGWTHKNPQSIVRAMKLIKRRFRLALGTSFAALGAFLFVGSLIAALTQQTNQWAAMREFGVFGVLIVIAGTAMCFERD